MGRLDSIDILRAVTMLLMIWVNDFWSLVDIPGWLKHMPSDADALGFSDVIFPLFLFIVGLSIPFSIPKRLADTSRSALIRHITFRTISLITMGVFLVNLENIQPAAMVLSKPAWQSLLIVSFFLIWNDYQKLRPTIRNLGISCGVVLLLILVVTYRGGTEATPIGMRIYWWGILGLIGWAYCTAASLYLLLSGKLTKLIAALAFLLLFLVACHAGVLDSLDPIKKYVWLVGDGSFAAFTMAGVVASQILKRATHANAASFVRDILIFAVIMCIFGVLTRSSWELSKIRATPAWVGYCTSISLLCLLFFHWLADKKKMVGWSRVIKPAGRYTLTCYLLPFLYYAFVLQLDAPLPEYLRTGGTGLIKSFTFAMLIVMVTGLINRIGIRLKL
ncbi:MAG: DUF1624 domain-containing protein [Saprospiraceae bacterium]|nr:DUF1624 domain-containing protein [Saprospiraceae bacterium]